MVNKLRHVEDISIMIHRHKHRTFHNAEVIGNAKYSVVEPMHVERERGRERLLIVFLSHARMAKSNYKVLKFQIITKI